jgi:glycerophosphoryl diester phosphodiesterase
MPYRDARRPRLFGHRGASRICPENTLRSFATALRGGATHLELDVHMSSDGHVIVLHDPRVDRTTNGVGEAREMTLKEIQALDAGCKGFRALGPDACGSPAARDKNYPESDRMGERIPTLVEVLDAFPGVPLNIEVKQREPAMVDAFFAALDAKQARENVLVAAEFDDIMAAVRSKAGGALTGFSGNEVLAFIMEGSAASYRPPGFALQVPETFEGMTVVTPEFIERAHRLGVEVHVWTVNEVQTAERLLGLGVDGIMSDVPGDLALGVAAFRSS